MSKSVTEIVDQLLEGKPLSDLLTSPEDSAITGKRLVGVVCPNCEAEDSMVVKKVLEGDNGFYTVVAECSSCSEPSELEIVVKEGTSIGVKDNDLVFEGKVFEGITAAVLEGGLMNGNYLKFGSGVTGYISKNEKGDNIISFEEPGEGVEYLPLNTKVTYKVISFRNQMARLMSMVNDNPNKLPSGTIFFADKKELQNAAKMAKPRTNASMDGRFKY